MMRDIRRTLAVVEAGMREGLHLGAQICAIVEGAVEVDAAVGLAQVKSESGGDARMGTDTLQVWLSAGKPVTAAGVLMLWDRGLVDLHESVARYVPEFGREGKEAITVWQLLTHTAGIRGADVGYPHATWEETMAGIYGMKMEKHWVPGLRAGYHQHTSWYVLGELIGRVTGVRCAQWIRENVMFPCGMADSWLGMEPERYRAYGTRMGRMYDTRTAPPERLTNLDSELGASRPRPSASCRGPARELARFYEMLRCGGRIGDVRLLKEETVTVMTTRQREGMHDQTLGHTVDWGLGVVVNSAHHGPRVPYQFGSHASMETFGHGGSRSSVGFCDPMRKLAAAVVFNGRPQEGAHDQRMRAVLGGLYEDLGLA
jgi:CubicO group peptidase (beta-lactamase class C family)